MAQIGVAARVVAGDAWNTTGVGLRSGLVGSFIHHAFSVELGHQWVRAGGRDPHDGRGLFSYELGIVARALVVLGAARAIFGGPIRWLWRR